MVPRYIHELKNWPRFTWDEKALAGKLSDVRHRQGVLLGRMRALGFELRAETLLETLTEDVLKSSEIEGEVLSHAQVRSSIARRLGMDVGALAPADRHVEGVVEMMLDATQNYRDRLTRERLFGWHAALFPTGRSGMRRIRVGKWRDDRDGPMQVVSGPVGRERVHYEGPPARKLESEMREFLGLLGGKEPLDGVLKAGVAHLWFVSIHPFDDGNGRIARAIADMQLARSEGSPQRFYSMSAQICAEKKDYYGVLESTQKGGLDITDWMQWFLGCLGRAVGGAESTLSVVLRKARFWEAHGREPFNDRQRATSTDRSTALRGNLLPRSGPPCASARKTPRRAISANF